ncbi:MAG TPA: hypothetical protein VGC41_20740 [Kofleriaceae bacterium]
MNRTWFSDGLHTAWHEIRAYLGTSWAMLRNPRRFADEWFDDRRAALNPLAMLATGATIVTACRTLGMTVLGIPHPDSLVTTILSALGPYAHYLLLGFICHFLVRGRGTLTDSIAMSLFAGAGPAALAESVSWLILCALSQLGGEQNLYRAIALGLAFSVFSYALSASLGGLHKVPGWRIALFSLSFPLSGLIFGYLQPPGSYGLHWMMRLDPFQIGLGL